MTNNQEISIIKLLTFNNKEKGFEKFIKSYDDEIKKFYNLYVTLKLNNNDCEFDYFGEKKINFNFKENYSFLFIGLLGNKKNGKTFILQKLQNYIKALINKDANKNNKDSITNKVNYEFIKTPFGLNFKLIENLLFIDTPSKENVFNYKNDNTYCTSNENFKINKTIYKIIKKYVLYKSNIILYVTGINNLSEEIKIKNLKEKIKFNQELIIIHNLYLLANNDFKEYKKEYQEKYKTILFEKEIITIENKTFSIYIEQINKDNNNYNIIHLFFGNDFHKEINKENQNILLYLIKKLSKSHYKNDYNEIDIEKDLNNFKQNNLNLFKFQNYQIDKIFKPQYFMTEIKDENNKTSTIQIVFQLSSTPPENIKVETKFKKNYLKLEIFGEKKLEFEKFMKESVYNYQGNIRGGNFYREIKIPYNKYIIKDIKIVNDEEENDNGTIKINLNVVDCENNKVVNNFNN